MNLITRMKSRTQGENSCAHHEQSQKDRQDRSGSCLCICKHQLLLNSADISIFQLVHEKRCSEIVGLSAFYRLSRNRNLVPLDTMVLKCFCSSCSTKMHCDVLSWSERKRTDGKICPNFSSFQLQGRYPCTGINN